MECVRQSGRVLEASVLDIYVQNFSHKPPACAGPEPAPLGLVVREVSNISEAEAVLGPHSWKIIPCLAEAPSAEIWVLWGSEMLPLYFEGNFHFLSDCG